MGKLWLCLLGHPKMGGSWEGYAIEEVLKLTKPDGAYFWATHTGAELDLLILKDGKRFGIEVKRQDAPRVTASMRIAFEDLRLDNLCVLYPGSSAYEPSRSRHHRAGPTARCAVKFNLYMLEFQPRFG